MSDTVLSICDLALSRPPWNARIDVLRVKRGSAWALTGPSGCGKTTALLAALGLAEEAIVDGEVCRGNHRGMAPGSPEHRRWLRSEVAVVMQDPVGALDPYEALGDQLGRASGAVVEAVQRTLLSLGQDTFGPDIDARAELDARRWAELLERRPYEISGGEAQRCLLAVALLRGGLPHTTDGAAEERGENKSCQTAKPQGATSSSLSLVVADEPDAHLDGANLERALDRLVALRDGGAGLLVATHNPHVVARLGATPMAWDGKGFTAMGTAAHDDWGGFNRKRAEFGSEVLGADGLAVDLGGRKVLRDLTFSLLRGELVAVVGASGAGKSTLGRVLAGHLRKTSGTLRTPERRWGVQMLFQQAGASLTPGRPVGLQLAEVAVPGFDPTATGARLGLPRGALQRCAHELSGGEQRRVALLRALCVRPEVLVCDEPLSSLDRGAGRAVTQLLLDVRSQWGISMIVFSHDRAWCDAVADRVWELRNGTLIT